MPRLVRLITDQHERMRPGVRASRCPAVKRRARNRQLGVNMLDVLCRRVAVGRPDKTVASQADPIRQSFMRRVPARSGIQPAAAARSETSAVARRAAPDRPMSRLPERPGRTRASPALAALPTSYRCPAPASGARGPLNDERSRKQNTLPGQVHGTTPMTERHHPSAGTPSRSRRRRSPSDRRAARSHRARPASGAASSLVRTAGEVITRLIPSSRSDDDDRPISVPASGQHQRSRRLTRRGGDELQKLRHRDPARQINQQRLVLECYPPTIGRMIAIGKAGDVNPGGDLLPVRQRQCERPSLLCRRTGWRMRKGRRNQQSRADLLGEFGELVPVFPRSRVRRKLPQSFARAPPGSRTRRGRSPRTIYPLPRSMDHLRETRSP